MMNIFKNIFAHNRKRQPIMTSLDLPLLLREKCGDNFDIEKIIGYQYSIGYITEDWDFPIENY